MNQVASNKMCDFAPSFTGPDMKTMTPKPNMTKSPPELIRGADPSQNASSIVDFYSNKCVLITGATGFLGKVILWKLLHTVPKIGTIYVLMRSKGNLSADRRLTQLLSDKPFNFKQSNPSEMLRKVVAIESDITDPTLGLSESDRKLLIENVNIVLHSAASVKFDAALKDNLRDNFYGTRSMVNLCDEIKNLNAFVHVSTAYSNCHKHEIQETIMPLDMEFSKAVKLIEDTPVEQCEAEWKKMVEGRPNTYCYTKALAEHLVATREGKYPVSIVRPSIIISSAEEPCPGWVDNVNGLMGLGCLAAIGVLRTIDWNYYATSDMVPCDYVANNVICAAYQVAEQSPKKLVIHNMTSGNMNPISWGVFFGKLRAAAIEAPSEKVVRPIIQSPKHNRANKISFLLTKVFSELFFAHFVDFLIAMLGYKRCMVRITNKMHHGYRILRPFTTNQWDFQSDNVTNLSNSLPPVDQKLYPFDMHGFDWDREAQHLWLSARRFLLKEEPTEESIKAAKKRLVSVTVVHYGFLAIIVLLLAYFSFSFMK